tara:strand:+ start:3632 stop:3889 length:258 start_codon:yes stop_codon:yes gene_type:complete
MKRRATIVTVSDHAVLRYLEREHGINVDVVRDHLAARAQTGAELGATAIQVERVKLVVRSITEGYATVVTVVKRGAAVTTRRGDR